MENAIALAGDERWDLTSSQAGQEECDMNNAKKLGKGDAVRIGLPIGLGVGVAAVLHVAIGGAVGVLAAVFGAGLVAGLTVLVL